MGKYNLSHHKDANRRGLAASSVSMEYEMYIVEVPEDLKEGFPIFIDRRHKDLEALQLALADNNMTAVYDIGHRMKGTGSVYGFSKLTDIGSELEKLSSTKDVNSLKVVVAQLKHALNNYKLKDS